MRRTFCVLALMLSGAAPALAWTVDDQTDRITGEREMSADARADQATLTPPRRPSRTNVNARIRLQCTAGKPSLVIYVPGELVGGHSRNEIVYRFDDAPPVRSRWRASTDNTAVGLWTVADVKTFLTRAKGKKRLLFRSEHDVFGTLEADFDLGDQSELTPVLTACKLAPAAPSTGGKRT